MSDNAETAGDSAGGVSVVDLHTPAPWRGWRQRHHDGMGWQWVLDSDTRGGMAILELPDMSKWYKDRHPDWAAEQRATLTEIDANFALIKASPVMLRGLRDVAASLRQFCEDIDDESACEVPLKVCQDWILQDLMKLQDIIAMAVDLEAPVPDDEL